MTESKNQGGGLGGGKERHAKSFFTWTAHTEYEQRILRFLDEGNAQRGIESEET